MYCPWAAFWPQAAAEQRLFQFTWFFSFYWDISALTGMEEYLHQALHAQVKQASRGLPPLRSSDVQRNKRKEYHSHRGMRLACLWHTPSFPDKLSWMPNNINTNTKPIDSIPSSTELCARPPTVALIVQSVEEWIHYVEFWGTASRWEQSDKAGNHHRGGKKI